MNERPDSTTLAGPAVFVVGIGWVTAAGFGQGRRGDRFLWGAGRLPTITRKHVFTDPRPHFGRMDGYSKLGVAGVAMALYDAGISRFEATEGAALVVSTVYGCLATDMNFLQTSQAAPPGSPHLFAYTLPSTFLGEAAMEFGFTGPTFLLHERGPAGHAALQTACSMIAGGETMDVVAGVCDVALPAVPACDTSHPGALFFVLGTEPRNGKPYGVLESRGTHLFFEQRPVADVAELAGIICGCSS